MPNKKNRERYLRSLKFKERKKLYFGEMIYFHDKSRVTKAYAYSKKKTSIFEVGKIEKYYFTSNKYQVEGEFVEHDWR